VKLPAYSALQYIYNTILVFQGKVYVFDRVFKANTVQEPVYAITAKPIVKGSICL